MTSTSVQGRPVAGRSALSMPFFLTAALVGLRFVRGARLISHRPERRVSAAEPKQEHRYAARPANWRDVLLKIWQGIGNHRVIAIAAGVTFYGLLAIFPAIAAIVSVYGLFADPASISNQLQSMSSVLPGGAIDVMQDQVTRASSTGHSTLGLTLIVGIIASLWSANAGMKSLIDALNVVYDSADRRGFIKLNAVSLSFTLSAIVFMLVAVAAVAILPIILRDIPFGPVFSVALEYARWPVLFIGIGLALACIYRYGPDREHAQWHWIT
jgi:membrane protein